MAETFDWHFFMIILLPLAWVVWDWRKNGQSLTRGRR
jgi:hypothetical protein